jgi:hypothetical protein
LVASNILTIAQWWPEEIQVARAPGIWINYRRERASPITVAGNVVHTPSAPPLLKKVIGLYALTVDGNAKVSFIDNIVNGGGNCTIGLLAASCWSNNSVRLLRGSLKDIRGTGVLADTLDPKWGPGNCCVMVSNVDISLSPGGVGVQALQELATPSNSTSIKITGNTRITGGACGVAVNGTNASGSIIGTAQQICGNDVGIYVSDGRAIVEGNVVTNNRVTGVVVENNGLVDAGDCDGINITGLGGGSGPNGASAGLNDFSGYGFDKLPPWAIRNSGPFPVLADRNFFNAGPGKRIDDGISGLVKFSGSGTLTISPPPAIEVQCVGQVPPAARTIEEFVQEGGKVDGGSAGNISSHDTIVTNRAGYYTVTRSYRIAGGCSQAVSCEQIITARDNQGPTLHCSDNIVQGVDPGRDYATVTFTNMAADSCGELLGTWVPVSTGQFPVGTNTVIVIATDSAANSSVCSFAIAVIDLPVITLQPTSRTNNCGTTASFKVAATSVSPMTFQWKKNGFDLVEGGRISGVSSTELTVAGVMESDEGAYAVDVSNLAGVTSSAAARLSVITLHSNLRLLGVSRGVATLELLGPEGQKFAILNSSNLAQWTWLCTNTAPFTLAHTNAPGTGCQFYRAIPLP